MSAVLEEQVSKVSDVLEDEKEFVGPDRAAAQARYRVLSAQLQEIETQIGTDIPGSSIVSPALAPISPGNPDRRTILVAGVLASLLVAIAAAMLREQLMAGIISPEELRSLGPVDDVVVLPAVDLRQNDRRSAADEITDAPLSPFSEAVRTLRTVVDQASRLSRNAPPKRGRLILVTSPSTGDGKTTTALALARCYALAGRKTLLLDCDLRRPSVAGLLGVAPEVGFLEYLREPGGKARPATFCGRDAASSLSLVMGSNPAIGPTDGLLASRTFGILVEQAREVFDIIIVDSPPLLEVVDGRILQRHADVVVLLARWAVTGQDCLARALSLVSGNAHEHQPVIGALGQTRPARNGRYFRRLAGYSAAI